MGLYALASGGSGTLNYTWDFGDGGSVSGIDLRAPEHVYDTNDPGNVAYTVAVTVSDGTESITQSSEILIDNLFPIVDAGPSLETYQGDSISFVGQATDPGTSTADIVSIEWDFDYDGTFDVNSSGSLTPSHQYDLPGAYIVALRATDRNGAASVAITSVEVNADGSLVVNAGSNQAVYLGLPVMFDGAYSGGGNVSSSNIQWDFDYDGTFEPMVSGTLTPTYTFTNPGTYHVALMVSDDWNNSEIDVIAVTADYFGPTAEAGQDLIATVGGMVSFSGSATDPDGTVTEDGIAWDFNYDGTFTPDVTGSYTPTYQFDTPGQYTVALRVIDDHDIGSIDFLTVTVDAVSPYVFAGLDDTVAADDSVTFGGSYWMPGTVTSGGIEWDFNYDGVSFNPDPSATGKLSPTHQFSTPGIYTVALRVTDSTSVSEIDLLAMAVVNARPVVNVNSAITITQGQTANFSATVSCADPVTIEWDFDYGDHEAFTPDPSANDLLNPTHQYLEAGTHLAAVRVTNTVGQAVSLRFVTVTVDNVSPNGSVSNSGPVAEGSPVQFTVSDLAEINPGAVIGFEADWTGNGEFQTIPADRWAVDPETGNVSFEYIFDDNGTYTVTIRILDDEGGYSDFTQVVTVENSAPNVVILAMGDTIGADVPFQFYAADPSHADRVAGFTYFVSVNGGSFVESTSSDFLLPSYAPGTYTLNVYVVDKDGGTSSVAATSMNVSESSTVLDNYGTGFIRLSWDGAPEPITLGPNETYNFGSIVSGLAITLLTSEGYYDIVTNGSIDLIDFEAGVSGIFLQVDTAGHTLMPPIVGDGHIGTILLPGGDATVGPSELTVRGRGDLGSISGPSGPGRLWAEAVDLAFRDLTGSITNLDHIRQIDARWLGDSTEDQVWANYGIDYIAAYGIRAALTSDWLRSTFDPLEGGSSVYLGHGGSTGPLDLGSIGVFGTYGSVDRLRIKRLSGEVNMEVATAIVQLQVDDTVGATSIRGYYGRIDLLALGEGARKNVPTIDYFPLAAVLHVGATPQDVF